MSWPSERYLPIHTPARASDCGGYGGCRRVPLARLLPRTHVVRGTGGHTHDEFFSRLRLPGKLRLLGETAIYSRYYCVIYFKRYVELCFNVKFPKFFTVIFVNPLKGLPQPLSIQVIK